MSLDFRKNGVFTRGELPDDLEMAFPMEMVFAFRSDQFSQKPANAEIFTLQGTRRLLPGNYDVIVKPLHSIPKGKEIIVRYTGTKPEFEYNPRELQNAIVTRNISLAYSLIQRAGPENVDEHWISFFIQVALEQNRVDLAEMMLDYIHSEQNFGVILGEAAHDKHFDFLRKIHDEYPPFLENFESQRQLLFGAISSGSLPLVKMVFPWTTLAHQITPLEILEKGATSEIIEYLRQELSVTLPQTIPPRAYPPSRKVINTRDRIPSKTKDGRKLVQIRSQTGKVSLTQKVKETFGSFLREESSEVPIHPIAEFNPRSKWMFKRGFRQAVAEYLQDQNPSQEDLEKLADNLARIAEVYSEFGPLPDAIVDLSFADSATSAEELSLVMDKLLKEWMTF